jgi:hypothetical protein
MLHKMDRKPRHAAYKRQHENEVEAERGWAGQHGQQPATEEEENYRPQKESHKPDMSADEDGD